SGGSVAVEKSEDVEGVRGRWKTVEVNDLFPSSTALYRLLPRFSEHVLHAELQFPAGQVLIHLVALRQRQCVYPALAHRVEAGPSQEVHLLEPGGRSDQSPVAADQREHVEHIGADLDRLAVNGIENLREPCVQEVHPGITTRVPR